MLPKSRWAVVEYTPSLQYKLTEHIEPSTDKDNEQYQLMVKSVATQLLQKLRKSLVMTNNTIVYDENEFRKYFCRQLYTYRY